MSAQNKGNMDSIVIIIIIILVNMKDFVRLWKGRTDRYEQTRRYRH